MKELDSIDPKFYRSELGMRIIFAEKMDLEKIES